MTARRKFGVVIVNHNCAPLALDAALSALGAAPAHVRAVIVDNASSDDSRERFRLTLERRKAHRPHAPKGGPMPVRFTDLSSVAAAMIAEGEAPPKEADLLVLLAQCNRGFAAGCNLGLKTLIAAGGAEFYVLLNPDALLCEGALAAFAERLSALDSGPCGASVLTYDSPHRAQAFGGASQDRLTLQGENIGAGERLADAPPTEAVEARMSYPLGCALAFRDRFLRDAGFLDERYFLYYEEADWTLAGGKQPLWARDAVVYHRYGGASKSRSPAFRSSLAEYHMARSRLLFALKWRPHLAPLMLVLALAQAGRRLLQGRFNAARALALGAMPGASSRFAG